MGQEFFDTQFTNHQKNIFKISGLNISNQNPFVKQSFVLSERILNQEFIDSFKLGVSYMKKKLHNILKFIGITNIISRYKHFREITIPVLKRRTLKLKRGLGYV